MRRADNRCLEALPFRGRETGSARPPPRMATMPARRLQTDPMATPLLEADLPGLHLRHRGKGRAVFDQPGGDADPKPRVVATAPLRALDVVLPDPLTAQGQIMFQFSH